MTALGIQVEWPPPGVWPSCRDAPADWWYPESYRSPQARMARRVCRSCPLRHECAQRAVDVGEEHGIWGGLTPHERTRIRHGNYAGCGTAAGYQRHRRRSEPICAPCQAAASEYYHDRRQRAPAS